MSALELSDGARFSECKDGTELERNSQDARGIHESWSNARRDPFVLKFPPEIASYIFFLCLDKRSDEEVAILPTPFHLGSVCHGWRLLARSTPELWSTLSFSIGKPTKPGGISQLQAVTEWLRLSGALPLAINVIWNRNRFSPEFCDPVIDIINQHSGRWCKLFFDQTEAFAHRFRGTSHPHNLRDLHFTAGLYDLPPTFEMISAPSPTRLTIFWFPILGLDIKWDNLTYLYVKVNTFDGCIEAIQNAPLLETCSIILHRWGSWPPLPKTSIRHMNIRRLKLSNIPFELLCSVLDALELPSLQVYHHETRDHDIKNGMDNVLSLVTRSGNDLKEIVLVMHNLHMEDLTKLSDAAPYLRGLNLSFGCTTDPPVIRDLFYNLSLSGPIGDLPTIFPRLRALAISAWSITAWDYIPCVFSSPHRKLLRLEVARLEVIAIDNDILRRILSLVDDGANIHIYFGISLMEYLPHARENFGKQNHRSSVVKHALEGEMGASDT
ncbi:hypothetical protein M413DRAFT_30338 [Hebeloma cylindrosporum]|uniref:Uncharacterized protein n=1 Tax=Hebeloma cylindrosporum TaxID=76867 RepID=A0A0C3C3Q8_HEBCY|nr:hypothetical protein M413DRAFT_30338 [Hebeloma cylindrosporum h7]